MIIADPEGVPDLTRIHEGGNINVRVKTGLKGAEVSSSSPIPAVMAGFLKIMLPETGRIV